MTDTDTLTPNLTESMSNGQKDHTLSLKAVADILGKSERTIYRYVKTDKLSVRVVKVGKQKQLRFNAEEVDKFRDTLTSDVNGKTTDMSKLVSSAEMSGFAQLYKELREKHDGLLVRLGYMEAKQQEIKLLEERVSSLVGENQTIIIEKKRIGEEKQRLEEELKALGNKAKLQTAVMWAAILLAFVVGIALAPNVLARIVAIFTGQPPIIP